MLRKIILSVLGIIILLVIVCAVLARPYLKEPAQSRESMAAKYAEYKKSADRVQNRPKADIETLLSVVGELEPVLKKETEPKKAMMGIPLSDDVGCPGLKIEDVRKSEADIKEVLARDDRLHAVLADGFSPQQDTGPDSDLPNFSWVRRYAFAQLAGAVLEFDQGKPGEAVQRILSVLKLSDGLIDTPFLIHCFTGITAANRTNEIIIYLAPKLSAEDLKLLRDAVAARPDAVEGLLNGLQTETVVSADTLKNHDKIKDGINYYLPTLTWTWPILKHTGIVKDAQWRYLSLVTRIQDFYREWQKTGAVNVPEIPKKLHQEFKTNVIAEIAIPNYGKLLERAAYGNVRKKSTLDAIDAELVLRQTGSHAKLQLPYDDEHKIIIENDYGCVVKTDKGK